MKTQSELFFYNDTAPTEIYTLPLHDALPIYHAHARQPSHGPPLPPDPRPQPGSRPHPAGHEPAHHRPPGRSEEHTPELQSPCNLVCRPLLEKKTLRLSPRPPLRTSPPRSSRS